MPREIKQAAFSSVLVKKMRIYVVDLGATPPVARVKLYVCIGILRKKVYISKAWHPKSQLTWLNW